MRVVILGNSGSGKSTLACWLAESGAIPVLDLDSLAWQPGDSPMRADPEAVHAAVHRYCAGHGSWVVEG